MALQAQQKLQDTVDTLRRQVKDLQEAAVQAEEVHEQTVQDLTHKLSEMDAHVLEAETQHSSWTLAADASSAEQALNAARADNRALAERIQRLETEVKRNETVEMECKEKVMDSAISVLDTCLIWPDGTRRADDEAGGGIPQQLPDAETSAPTRVAADHGGKRHVAREALGPHPFVCCLL